MKKNLEYFVKILIYGTFFVPLVVVPSSFIFPFIVPKILLLRTLVTLMIGGYVLLLAINWEEYKPRFTPVSAVLLLFLLSFALSTFVGVDAYHSFWDNHERMLGLFTILHYIAYYFVVTALFRSWEEWKWALRFFLMAGSICMFIGFLQIGNSQLLLNQGNSRVASTLGNPIYVGGYGLFLFFVALLLFLKEKNVAWKVASVFFGFLALIGLFYSGTRGSVLGFFSGVVSVLVGGVYLYKNNKLRRVFGGGLVALVLVLGLLYINRTTAWVNNIPTVGHLFSTSIFTGTGNSRLIAWKIAIESWKERPIFGWGPNNFFYAFNQHYNPKSLESGYGETWFDNAHNIILNTLAVQGLVGLLSYLGIFIVATVLLWKAYKVGRLDRSVIIIGFSFLAAHLVQNIFVFENPTSYLYFVFWLALINRLASPIYHPASSMEEKTLTANTPDRNIGFGTLSGVGAFCLLIIFIFNIQPARANSKTLGALQQLVNNTIVGFGYVKEALNFNSPHIDDIRSDLSREVIEVISRANKELGPEKSREMLTLVQEVLEKDVVLHPRDIRLYMMLTQVSQLQFIVSNDARYLLRAQDFLTTALTYSPRRQQFMYMLATIDAQLGKKDEAIRVMEETIADDDKIGEGYWRLAYLYYYFGNHAKAKEIIDLASQKGVTFDAQGQQVEAMVNTAVAPAPGTKK